MLRQGLSTLLAPVRKFAGRTAASAAGKAAGGLAPMGTAADAARAVEPQQSKLLSVKLDNAVHVAKGPMVPPVPSLASRGAVLRRPAGGAAPRSAGAPSAAKKPVKAPSKAKKNIKKVNPKSKTKKAGEGAAKPAPPKVKKVAKAPKVKKAAKPLKAKRVIKKK